MKRATIEDMELGNMMQGGACGDFVVERDGIIDKMFSIFMKMNGFDGYGYLLKDGKSECGYENDVFAVRPYYWGDDPDEMEKPNFEYKPTGLTISWYKYPMRDAYINQDINMYEFREILEACEKSMEGGNDDG